MFHFYIPEKGQNTKGFLTFLRDIKIDHWAKIGKAL